MADLLKVFKNLSIVLILSSCSYFQKQSLNNSVSNNNKTQIRIVDLNGKPHQVKTRVPELNAEIMARINQNNNSLNNQTPIINKKITYDTVPENSLPYDKAVVTSQTVESEKFDSSGYNIQNTNQDHLKAVSDNNLQLSGADRASNIADFRQNSGGNDIANSQIAMDRESNAARLNNYGQSNSGLLESKGNSKNFKFRGLKVAAGDIDSAPKVSKIKNATHGIFVQSGSFSSIDNANQNLRKVSVFHKAMVEESLSGDKKSYRVLIGPFSNKKQAQIMIRRLSKSGQKSFLVKK